MLIGHACALALRFAVIVWAIDCGRSRRQKTGRPRTNCSKFALTLARRVEDSKQAIARDSNLGYEEFARKPFENVLKNPIDT